MEEVIKRKRGRPHKDSSIITPIVSTKSVKVSFDEDIFWNWLNECSEIVLYGWELQIRNYKSYIEVVRMKDSEEMPFAFIDRKNGDILCPAVMHGDPLETVRGNIADPKTRLVDITPYGVKQHWSFLPTHENYTLHLISDLSLNHLSDNIV